MSDRLDVRELELEGPPVVLFERRRQPDRRRSWRGGRRDSDWLDRPLGALPQFERSQRGRPWHWWLSASRVNAATSSRHVGKTPV